MSPELPTALVREGFTVLATVGGPLFGALLLVGLVVGILQAVTQVNDAAVGAVPKLAVVLLVLLMLGGWMAERLAAFFAGAVARMVGG